MMVQAINSQYLTDSEHKYEHWYRFIATIRSFVNEIVDQTSIIITN